MSRSTSRSDAVSIGPERASGPVSGPARAASTPLFSFGPWLWGTLGILLAAVAATSGLGLVFFYQPEESSRSLIDLEQATDFGFLRDLHFWAAQGLLLAAWLHLARVFSAGSYRRRLGWRVTVALVVLVTFEAWLGDRLGEPQASRAVFAAHVLVVPVLFAGFVALWQRRRRATPLPAIGTEMAAADTPSSQEAESLQDELEEPRDKEAQEPQEPSEGQTLDPETER